MADWEEQQEAARKWRGRKNAPPVSEVTPVPVSEVTPRPVSEVTPLNAEKPKYTRVVGVSEVTPPSISRDIPPAKPPRAAAPPRLAPLRSFTEAKRSAAIVHSLDGAANSHAKPKAERKTAIAGTGPHPWAGKT
jgi:hypothetical protein